jgi:hypothetical protein
MAQIIEYKTVLLALQREGLECLYHNSGAFGFPKAMATQSRGWIGPPDGSIRDSARALVRAVPAPYEVNLAALASGARDELLGGEVWAMPKSHWAHELGFGKSNWMAGVLERIGIDAGPLAQLNTAEAIAFSADERASLHHFIRELLENLHGSDFQLVFPGRRAICTVHSHKQLWWTTSDERIAVGLDRLFDKTWPPTDN